MAETNEIQRAVEDVGAAERHSDELEIARRVYGLYKLMIGQADKPSARVRELCQLVDLPDHRVRRLLALATAPQRLRDLFVEGRIHARIIELLQSLPEAKQVQAAERMVLEQQNQLDAANNALDEGQVREGQGGSRQWSEEAQEFEAALCRSIALMDRYFDISPRRLRALMETVGVLGRRHLLTLIDDQISLLMTLKRSIEPEQRDRKGGLNGNRSHVVAESS